MKNKYYIPKIEEFYKGFEYERIVPVTYQWTPLIFDIEGLILSVI